MEENFFVPYVLKYPQLNQSTKWRHDYITAFKKGNKKSLKQMLYWTSYMKI